FDPGPGVFNLTSAGGSDAFVARYSPTGALLWARSAGGTGNDQGSGIAVDLAGNAYVTGSFSGTADFDPSAATSNLVSTGSLDAFAWKLDSQGNLAWARKLGGTGSDAGNGIALDSLGNVLVA